MCRGRGECRRSIPVTTTAATIHRCRHHCRHVLPPPPCRWQRAARSDPNGAVRPRFGSGGSSRQRPRRCKWWSCFLPCGSWIPSAWYRCRRCCRLFCSSPSPSPFFVAAAVVTALSLLLSSLLSSLLLSFCVPSSNSQPFFFTGTAVAVTTLSLWILLLLSLLFFFLFSNVSSDAQPFFVTITAAAVTTRALFFDVSEACRHA
mmetsp:Transcript_18082/g.37959  ORF Transcript_18082/g.37959 Transcript_18082/m.37959 type:complete len:203 (-) Transcript_18082:113-721(-)